MVVAELLQRIQSLYSKGAQSNSSRLMSRQTYSVMLSVRSTLMFNKLNKNQFISLWNYTLLPCVEMKLVNQNECPCIPAPGCTILRSVHKLPKPLNSISKYMIDSVTSIDGQTLFSEVTYLRKNWRKYDKWTSTKPDYFIKDDYLYISVTRKIKAVTVTLLVHDPYEALSYPSACGVEGEVKCPPSILEMDFSIDEDLVQTLIEMTARELLIIFTPREDRAADGVDNPDANVGGQVQQRRQEQSE